MPVSGTSLLSIMNSAQNSIATSIPRSQWDTAVAGTDQSIRNSLANEPYCNLNGINVNSNGNPTSARCRIGNIINDQDDCNTPDMGQGVGCSCLYCGGSALAAGSVLCCYGSTPIFPSFVYIVGEYIPDGIYDSHAFYAGGALLAKINGNNNNWKHYSSLWTDSAVSLNPTSLAFDQTEARLPAFSTLMLAGLKIGTAPIGSTGGLSSVTSWISISFTTPSTLLALMSTGDNALYSSLPRSSWDALFINGRYWQYNGEPNCNVNGINVRRSSTFW